VSDSPFCGELYRNPGGRATRPPCGRVVPNAPASPQPIGPLRLCFDRDPGEQGFRYTTAKRGTQPPCSSGPLAASGLTGIYTHSVFPATLTRELFCALVPWSGVNKFPRFSKNSHGKRNNRLIRAPQPGVPGYRNIFNLRSLLIDCLQITSQSMLRLLFRAPSLAFV